MYRKNELKQNGRHSGDDMNQMAAMMLWFHIRDESMLMWIYSLGATADDFNFMYYFSQSTKVAFNSASN